VIMYLETNVDKRPIAISATQEPFTQIDSELDGLPHAVWAERIVCDREARYWMDIHAFGSREPRMQLMRRSATDDTVCHVLDGIPIEIDDEMIEASVQ
jgi:hypothetical protein